MEHHTKLEDLHCIIVQIRHAVDAFYFYLKVIDIDIYIYIYIFIYKLGIKIILEETKIQVALAGFYFKTTVVFSVYLNRIMAE